MCSSSMRCGAANTGASSRAFEGACIAAYRCSALPALTSGAQIAVGHNTSGIISHQQNR
jgi:hypothetical protein